MYRVFTVIMVVIPVIALFIFFITFRYGKNVKETTAAVVHTEEVISNAKEIVILSVENGSATRDFIHTGDKSYLAAMASNNARLLSLLRTIDSLHGKEDLFRSQIDSLRFYVEKRISLSNEQIRLFNQGKRDEAKALLDTKAGIAFTNNIERIASGLSHVELEHLAGHKSKYAKAVTRLKALLFVVIGTAFILGIFAVVRLRRAVMSHLHSEEKFKTLLESAPDATVITDERGDIVMVNNQAETFFGYTKEELLGSQIEMLIPEDYRKGHIGSRNRFFSKPSARKMDTDKELVALKKDGKKIPVEISLSPIRTEDGILMSASVRDITAKKKAQAQIELMFRQINEAHEAIYIINGDMIIQSWNHGAELLYGYNKDEAIGKKSTELLDTHLTSAEYQSAYKTITESGYWSGEVHRKTKSGDEIIVYSSLTAIRDAAGIVGAYVSVSYDITENRKLAEKVNFLAAIEEQSNDAIISLDLDNYLLSWNKGAEKVFGYKKEEMLGFAYKQRKTGFDLSGEEMEKNMSELQKNGTVTAELKFTRKNGTVFFALLSGNLIYDKNGKIKAKVYFIRDISRRKNLEEQLRQVNADLEKKVEERAGELKRSEEQYRYMFENNPMPMWVFDPVSLFILAVNNSAIGLYGYTREEFLKIKVVDLRPEEDKKLFMAPENINEMYNTKSSRGVWRHLKKSGELMIVEVIAYSSVYEGKQARLIMINDITEIRNAESRLIASEKRFRTLIENNNDIVSLMNADGKIFYRSPSAARVTGWSDDECMRMDFFEGLLHLDDRERIKRIIVGLISRPGGNIVTTYRLRHKDGHYLDMEATLTNSLQDEQINAIILNTRDITKRRQAEDRLMKSEMRFRSLIENNSDVIGLLDENGKFTYGSPSATRVTGWTFEEYSQQGFLAKAVHPEDLGHIAALIEEVKRNPGKAIESHARILHKKGYYIYIEGSMINLLNAEFIKAIVFNYKDVTEKKEAEDNLIRNEKRFRSMIENSYDIVVLMDESFHITYRSPSAIKLTGNTDEEVLHTSALERVHPDDIPEIMKQMQGLLATPGAGGMATFRYMAKDGNYLWMEGTATNLLHEESVKAIVFNYRDVTERINSERIIRESEERYRTTLDNMIEGVQIIGFDWRYKYVNETVLKQARMSKTELIGHTMSEKFPGIEHSGVYRAIKRCFDERVPILLDNEWKHDDGKVSWFTLSIQPVPEGVFILSVDITETVLAEQKLKAEEDKLASIALTAPGLIYSFRLKPDGSMGFPYVSRSVDDVFGVIHEDVKDNIEMIISNTVEEDRELLINSIFESARTLSPWRLEFRYHHPVRGQLWLDGNSIPTRETDGSIIWYGVVTDVTERKASEARISAQRAQLKTLSDNLPGLMIYQMSGTSFEDRRFTYVSNEVTRLTGKSPEEVIENPVLLYEIIYEEDVAWFLEEERKAYEYFTVLNVEVRCRSHKGEIRWLHVVSVPRQAEDGRIIWDGFHVDITERKRSQEEIRQSNERFEMVAKATKDIVWDLNPETNEIWWNENYYTFFGYEKDGANQLASAWEQHIHPEDKERVISNFSKYFERKEPLWKDEYRFIKKNGEIAYIYDCGYILYDEKGKPYRAVGSMIDITEITDAQRELRESLDENMLLTGRLSTILDTLPAHIALLAADGSILDVNNEWKSFTRQSGFAGNKYGIGENYIEFSGSFLGDNEEKYMVSEGVKKVLERKNEEFVYEYLSPGSELKRWFKMIVTPLKGNENKGAVVMHIDISEIKRLEEERIKTKTEEQRKITEAMLQGQEKERNAIGIELHDNVNQILVGTKVLLSVVRDFPDKREELVPSCIENINLAIQENRKIAHELVTPNLSNEDLIKQIRRLGDTMLKNAEIKAHIKHDRFNEELLNNDMKLAVYRVAQEQCTNIIKYAEAGHVIFSLKTADGRFFMRITDDGKGMDKENVTHGIGLKNMASRLGVFGGTINVETEPEEGFTLEIEIPLKNTAD